MADELKPCPFCGGEAQVVRKPYETKFCVGCGDDACLGFSGLGWLYETEEQAAAAWNRRAERTCRVVRTEEPSPTGAPRECRCSECGGMLTRFGAYCHNCGARVVE